MPTLTWLGKEEAVHAARKVPFRLLEHDPTLSYGDPDTQNMLIQSDNLEALKTLLPFYAGQVKYIYIDPPYNTGSAFEHYDDNLEHSMWLSLMYPRLELLRELLSEEGSIWISIDDQECHYLKTICDEVFGRRYFTAEIIWQKRASRENRAAIGSAHDTILVYAKQEAKEWKSHRNLLPVTGTGYSNPDSDSRGPWRSIPFSAQGFRPNQMYEITTPTGKVLVPPKGRCWAGIEQSFNEHLAENRVFFPNKGNGRPRIKQFAYEEKGLVPMTLWLASEAGTTEQSKKEILALFEDEAVFGTPKPETLIKQVITIATNPGDLVLDSFLGSGTTAAVAHKMGRRYIGIELGDHAVTHCAPRLQKVIDGEQGGISKDVGWQGGGGFRFYRLGETVFDETGRIHAGVRFPALAAHIWFTETGSPLGLRTDSSFLGEHGGKGYYLLYNGILGDRSVSGGNVLTRALLAQLPPCEGVKVIYGERSTLCAARLKELGVLFRQIPYDVKAR
jgi:adenine-specific DNA-methyltransferase